MKKGFQLKASMLLCCFLTCFTGSMYAEGSKTQHNSNTSPLENSINQKISLKKYQHSDWIILAKDLTTNKVIYQHMQNSMLNPASITKLFSTAAALHYLGYDYRFRTPVYFVGNKNGTTLNGDLILVGQGDLTLGFRYKDDKILYENMDHIYANSLPITSLVDSDPLYGLKELAQQIAKTGVKTIKGNVLIDNRLFDTAKVRNYILSPTMINEGFIDLVIKPTQAGKKPTVAMVPNNNFYTLKNEAHTIANGKSNVEAKLDAESKTITLTGYISTSDKQIFRNVSVKKQREFARAEFIKLLKTQGIRIEITAAKANLPAQNTYKQLTPIATLVSPPLIEYAKLILKTSHNPGADLMSLLIAAHFGKKTYDEGMAYIGSFLRDTVKLDPNTFVFAQASGGTSLNKVTPQAVIQLLTYIYHQPKQNFEAFKNALPILGVNGSLFLSGKNSPAKGHLFAKTGTQINYDLTNQRFWYYSEALGGYIINNNNHVIAFVVSLENLPMKGINDTFIVQDAVSAVASEFY